MSSISIYRIKNTSVFCLLLWLCVLISSCGKHSPVGAGGHIKKYYPQSIRYGIHDSVSFMYDDNMRLVRKFVLNSNLGFHDTVIVNYKYTPNGFLDSIISVMYNTYSINGVYYAGYQYSIQNMSYTYDGTLIRINYYSVFNTSGVTNNGYDLYYHNAKKQVDSIVSFNFSGANSFVRQSCLKLEYDSAGNVVKTSTIMAGPLNTPVSVSTYTYDNWPSIFSNTPSENFDTGLGSGPFNLINFSAHNFLIKKTNPFATFTELINFSYLYNSAGYPVYETQSSDFSAGYYTITYIIR